MSVLDDFLRIRLYRKQAAEFQWLADNASIAGVQRRYRAVARHYSELADREERAVVYQIDRTKKIHLADVDAVVSEELGRDAGHLNLSDVEICEQSIGLLTSPGWFRCQL